MMMFSHQPDTLSFYCEIQQIAHVLSVERMPATAHLGKWNITGQIDIHLDKHFQQNGIHPIFNTYPKRSQLEGTAPGYNETIVIPDLDSDTETSAPTKNSTPPMHKSEKKTKRSKSKGNKGNMHHEHDIQSLTTNASTVLTVDSHLESLSTKYLDLVSKLDKSLKENKARNNKTSEHLDRLQQLIEQ